ncbi:MAG TPA: bifunctional phosphopantothenoylcysteine decarboxylase/phosphopantothenate--cysteine ligase CoaBC [Microthrixaceae bacterium]|nr:bifunctional phosphopantothenoylcysteine decarboxylase/phosphopantothenate--cysteine ligase CoaBC [Microthrixaceae bacterium]
MDLTGYKVVLGVCGGIAAYKAIEVSRRLVDAGAHVVPVMTSGARKFVGEVTLSALASEPVRTSLFDDPTDPIPHTSLGQGADLILVAPATARLLSAYASGYSHDLLTNVLLATRAPVMVCPAMHTEMWEHPAVEANIALLRQRGVHVVDPGEGRLAGGDIGAGRLAEPAEIVEAATALLLSSAPGASSGASGASSTLPTKDLLGLDVLITAGGTREPIDPVRFIGNRSSGKQGHLIAEQASRRGASVTLVTSTKIPTGPEITRIEVDTAQQLHDAVMAVAPTSDVIVMAAAVADFTPVAVAETKLKKRDGVPAIELVPTVDVLAGLGAQKPVDQTLVGFAAETADVRSNAEAKLRQKGADILVVNDVSAPGVGFEFDTNEVLILGADGTERHVPLTDKRRVADAVLDAVVRIRVINGTITPPGEEA